MKYYVDTSIWRDFYEDRKDRLRPLGEFAFEFFKMVKTNHEKVLYSELVIKELLVGYSNKNIEELFEFLTEGSILEKVKIKKRHILEAVRLSKKLKIPFGDCLHALLARDNNAIVITRDKHFDKLRKIVTVKKPEEII